MSEPQFDVVGLGNALVDILTHVDDVFIEKHGMTRGAMMLVDEPRARELYAVMPPGIEMSGGSAGNMMAGLASLGSRGAYIGRVSDDEFGALFRHDIRAAGVAFDVPSAGGAATGRSLILVTPDAQRTMNTFLGAAAELTPADVDEALVRSAAVTFVEGYLWDPPEAKDAVMKAIAAATSASRRVALTLSDAFCVDRYRAEFADLIDQHVDVLFANESEIVSLYETSTFDEAVSKLRGRCEIAALTRSEKGSVIVAGDDTHVIAAEPVERVVDTTGAGDQYAAGFLAGLTQGRDPATCGRMGSICAAEIISQFGARPETSLKDLVARKIAR